MLNLDKEQFNRMRFITELKHISPIKTTELRHSESYPVLNLLLSTFGRH